MQSDDLTYDALLTALETIQPKLVVAVKPE